MTSSLDFVMGIAICLLSVYDTANTEHRIKKYGLDVELNPAMGWLVPRLGLDLALALAIMIPTLAMTAVFISLGWRTVLAVWLGMKAITARYQYISSQLEEEIDKIRAIQDLNRSTAAPPCPVDDSRPGKSS